MAQESALSGGEVTTTAAKTAAALTAIKNYVENGEGEREPSAAVVCVCVRVCVCMCECGGPTLRSQGSLAGGRKGNGHVFAALLCA